MERVIVFIRFDSMTANSFTERCGEKTTCTPLKRGLLSAHFTNYQTKPRLLRVGVGNTLSCSPFPVTRYRILDVIPSKGKTTEVNTRTKTYFLRIVGHTTRTVQIIHVLRYDRNSDTSNRLDVELIISLRRPLAHVNKIQ